MKKLILLLATTTALLSCSKQNDCYECTTERYNEYADTNYTTTAYICDVSESEIKEHEKANTGRTNEFIQWENSFYNMMITPEQHVTKCKKYKK